MLCSCTLKVSLCEGMEERGVKPDMGKWGDALEKEVFSWCIWDKVVFNVCPSGLQGKSASQWATRLSVKETSPWRHWATAVRAWVL